MASDPACTAPRSAMCANAQQERNRKRELFRDSCNTEKGGGTKRRREEEVSFSDRRHKIDRADLSIIDQHLRETRPHKFITHIRTRTHTHAHAYTCIRT